MKKQLISLAQAHGFPACAFASLNPVEQTDVLHPQAESLTGDAASLDSGMKCVMLCAMPYQPFALGEKQAHVDAYYLTSNRAHEAIQALACDIESSLSIHAVAAPPIYLKPLAVRSGLGEFGRNGLVSVDKYGTRVALQAILLNADIETHDRTVRGLSSRCERCSACVSACPVSALDGTGRVDITKCLRAQPEGEPYPESMRPHLGGSLLGCDLCQKVCPRNAQVSNLPMPDDLRSAIDLHALLSGNYKPLIPFLGKNNARRQRLTARALIAAANLNRHDLIPLIAPLTACRESEMVRLHAQWALDQLSTR